MDLRGRKNDADVLSVWELEGSQSIMGSWIYVRKNSNMSQHRVYRESEFINEAVRQSGLFPDRAHLMGFDSFIEVHLIKE